MGLCIAVCCMVSVFYELLVLHAAAAVSAADVAVCRSVEEEKCPLTFQPNLSTIQTFGRDAFDVFLLGRICK